MTFEEVKAEYEQQREQERIGLLEYLSTHKAIKAAGLYVVTSPNAGKGRANYTAHNRIPSFDL